MDNSSWYHAIISNELLFPAVTLIVPKIQSDLLDLYQGYKTKSSALLYSNQSVSNGRCGSLMWTTDYENARKKDASICMPTI